MSAEPVQCCTWGRPVVWVQRQRWGLGDVGELLSRLKAPGSWTQPEGHKHNYTLQVFLKGRLPLGFLVSNLPILYGSFQMCSSMKPSSHSPFCVWRGPFLGLKAVCVVCSQSPSTMQTLWLCVLTLRHQLVSLLWAGTRARSSFCSFQCTKSCMSPSKCLLISLAEVTRGAGGRRENLHYLMDISAALGTEFTHSLFIATHQFLAWSLKDFAEIKICLFWKDF